VASARLDLDVTTSSESITVRSSNSQQALPFRDVPDGRRP
jgi:hypothetical protein